MSDAQVEKVKHYYAEVLQTKRDLRSTACCSAEQFPPHLLPIVRQVHPEVLERFYGCGAPLPLALEGTRVLDLGCGTGRDCFLLSALVGPDGSVHGVDMLDEQLDVGRRLLEYHREAFGLERSNVTFTRGYIEDLQGAGIPDESVDLVVSNCVFNLSPDKERLLGEVFRVLKPGGELYFADVFADRRLTREQREDPLLLGECIGGAMYVEDFRRTLAGLGVADHRVCKSSPIGFTDAEIGAKVGNARFDSLTIRAFKLELEDRCEDYGQVATYLGTIPEAAHGFELDDHHFFETNRPMLVCSNTARMITRTRYAPHFRLDGDESTHFGLFDCGPAVAPGADGGGGSSGCC